jgi:hypothetical protein
VSATVDPGMYAVRYCDLINVCTRTGGAAWTAALSGIDYAGLKLSSHIQVTDSSSTDTAAAKAVNVGTLADDAAVRCLDHGKDSLDWKTVSAVSTLQCQDMMTCLLQIALRYSMLQSALEGSAQQPSALHIIVPKLSAQSQEKPYMPLPSIVQSILDSDLQLQCSEEACSSDSSSTVFRVSETEVAKWQQANALE